MSAPHNSPIVSIDALQPLMRVPANPVGLSSAGGMLIASANDDAAHSLQYNAAGLGYTARVSPDGPTALAYAGQQVGKIKMVVVDGQLPGTSAYEVRHQIRAMYGDRGKISPPIILLGDQTDRGDPGTTGFDAQLPMTPTVDELVAAIWQASETNGQAFKPHNAS